MQDERQKEIAKRLFFEEDRQDWRASITAFALALFIHLAVFFILPANFLIAKADSLISNLELEILPPELELLNPEEPERRMPIYVEANPDANMDAPTRDTNQESFQDQTTAQENPDPESNDSFPEVHGEKEDSMKIVSGDLKINEQPNPMSSVFETLDRPLERPSQESPAIPQTDAQAFPVSQGGRPQDSSPIANKVDADEGIKTSENLGPEVSQDTPEKEEPINEQEPVEEKNEIAVADMLLPKPAPRKTLGTVITRTPPGPIANKNTKANKLGIVAVDSKFSEFGAYMQRMVEAIATQWNLLGSRYEIGPIYGTVVTVEFFVDPEGEITSYKTTFNSSTITGRNLCEQAILSTAPFGMWTGEMKALFGDQDQRVTFTFYYR